MFKPVHFTVTIIRSTQIIKRLHNKYNFVYGKTDDQVMQTILDFVMLRTLSNDQICQEIIEMHMVNLEEVFN